jgi:hypothetical protein
MATVIVHPAPPPDAGVWVIFPAANCPLAIEDIAKKDVPAGLPYVYVDDSELPDQQYREAWDCDFSEPDGYGLGYAGYMEAKQGEQDEAQSDEGG